MSSKLGAKILYG
jgi:hypothetical protein